MCTPTGYTSRARPPGRLDAPKGRRQRTGVLELDYEDGLVRVRAAGEIDVAEMEAHFAALEDLAARTDGPVAAVVDARGVALGALRRAHRDCAVRALRRIRPSIEGRYVAQAFVFDSAFGRALVAMLNLVVRPARRTRCFRDLAAAQRWAESELRGARRA